MKKYQIDCSLFIYLEDLYNVFGFDKSVLSVEDCMNQLLSIEEETVVEICNWNQSSQKNRFVDLLENVQQKNDYLYLIRG